MWSPGPDPKIGPSPLNCALIGGAQLIWLVGPRRPRYIETGRGSGLVIPSLSLPQTLPTSQSDPGKPKADGKLHQRRHDVHRRHFRPRPVPVQARRVLVPSPPTAAAGSAPQRAGLPRLHPRLHRRDGTHRHQLVSPTTDRRSASSSLLLFLCTSLGP